MYFLTVDFLMLHEAQSRLVEHYIYTAYKHQCLIVVIVSDQRIVF